jgi:hypothetical protein
VAAPLSGVEIPGEPEACDVVLVDPVEPAVALLGVAAAVAEPALGLVCGMHQARVVHTRRPARLGRRGGCRRLCRAFGRGAGRERERSGRE